MTYFLGVLQADPGIIRDSKQIFRLFCHESLRVFHDRLINHEDKNYYYGMLSEMANKHFGEVCFDFPPMNKVMDLVQRNLLVVAGCSL